MKNNIVLNFDHSNVRRLEFFLNHLKEKLIEVPYDWKGLKLVDRMTGGARFESAEDIPVTITVFLCDSYQDATDIARANSFPITPTAKWSINGDILYIVESADEEKVSEILSFFAGEE